jgi:hypothetical protein
MRATTQAPTGWWRHLLILPQPRLLRPFLDAGYFSMNPNLCSSELVS